MLALLTRNLLLAVITCLIISSTANADTPVGLYESYAGNVDFVGTQQTRRTQTNGGGGASCTVLPASTTNTATISGIPVGATIRAAHLYWAGTFSSQAGSTRTTPDYNVTFEGNSITADRKYTADYDATERYYSGVEDVTSIVQSRGSPNGSYSFSGLSVNTAAPHCTFATVLAGWSLVIIYEDPSEDFRVVNLFEGFQLIYGESVTLTPDNFRIPSAPINGRHAYLTWDGDAGNSGSRNGFIEGLTFNGTALFDPNNPINNIYNSISTLGGLDTNSHGVDFDVYDIDSLLSAGQTTATSVYSSGSDQVHLSMEIISVTNTPVSDLSITKTAASSFNIGNNAIYNLVVNNAGPNVEPGNIVVTDTLPVGLSFVSATGAGWSCTNAGQNVTCTRSGNLAVGANTSTIVLTVAVSAAAAPSVSNTASVSGANFDNVAANDDSTATTSINTGPNISLQKTTITISDPVNGTTNPKAIPGALSEYTIRATNTGTSPADNNSISISDAIPSNTALYVGDISGAGSGPIRFVDGSPPSGLSYNYTALGNTSDNLSFSNNNGTSYTYVPSPDAEGVDTNVTNIRVSTLGQFLASGGGGNPSFNILFRVKVQ